MLTAAQRLIRLRTVREKTGLSKSTIYALVQQDRFPRPLKLGERSSGWIEAEVDSWIAGKVAARRVSPLTGL
jgi:prophage regulatory protein